jgi:DNA invertase Pin-like site-specific DNA recombinase
MRVAIYARVSTKDKGQDTENPIYQLRIHQLRAFAERHGLYIKGGQEGWSLGVT